MKRIIVVISIASVVFCITFFSFKPLLRALIVGQLKAVCKDAVVSAGNMSVEPSGRFGLIDIAIQRPQVYKVMIGRASVQVSLGLLLKGVIAGISLDDVQVSVTTPQKNIAELRGFFKEGSSPGIFKVRECSLSNVALDIKAKDLIFRAEGSCQVDVITRFLQKLDLAVSVFQSQGIQAHEARLSIRDAKGDLLIQKISYNKLTLDDISAQALISDNAVVLSKVIARLLQGVVEADIKLELLEPMAYHLRLKAKNIDLARAIEAFDLKKKFQLDGQLLGDLEVRGSGQDFSVIDGSFASELPGGRLTITDTQFLQRLAGTTQQSLDLVGDSFKEYRFQDGNMSVSLEGKDVALDVKLAGEAGKRNLSIILHDFSIKDIQRYLTQ